MKKWMKYNYLPGLMLACGVLGLVLRELLYMTAVDSQGLMDAGHPLETALWLLTLGVFALVAVLAVRLGGGNDFAANFPAGVPGAVGCFVMAASVILTVFLQQSAMGGTIGRLWRWFGLAAGVGLIWIGLCRLDGKKPGFVSHLGLCMFLTIHILSHYQAWSRRPFLQDYVFSLLGAVVLLLFTYYQMAFDEDLGKRRMTQFMGLASIFLCTAALSSCGYWLLYLGAIGWVWTNLCSWDVPATESVK